MRVTEAMPIEMCSRYALNRFAIKLAIVTVSALAQNWMPWGFGKALLALSAFSALIDILLAIRLGERPASRTLGYWDEAAAFIAISLVTLAFLKA
jgi:uncharacterized membrane protein